MLQLGWIRRFMLGLYGLCYLMTHSASITEDPRRGRR
mgnify:CR=1 FL=1